MSSKSENLKKAWQRRYHITVEDYIFSKIEKMESGCWHWKGSKPHRSGGFAYKGEHGGAPRKVYEHLVSSVPEGLFVLHKCDNHQCVNPNHLYAGTKKQNRQDFMERHPRARELLMEGIRKASQGVKRKWDSMTGEERKAFIEMRTKRQMEKHPSGSPARIKAVLSRQETLRRRKENGVSSNY